MAMGGCDFDPQFYQLDWLVDHTNDLKIATPAAGEIRRLLI